MKPWLQSLYHVILLKKKKMTQNPYAFAYVVCVSVSVLRICFASEIDLPSFQEYAVNHYIMHLSMLSRRGEGGGRQGMGWRFDIFQKFAFKFPAHGQTILFNCNQVSPPWAAHFCPSQGWTKERHNKNISK